MKVFFGWLGVVLCLCFGFGLLFRLLGCALFGVRLGAFLCCLGCVPAHFHVVERDVLGC